MRIMSTQCCAFRHGTGENTMAGVICRELKIEKKRWDMFRDVVDREINVRRNNASTAIKKEYMGKSRNSQLSSSQL
jgi:hypothetical protein